MSEIPGDEVEAAIVNLIEVYRLDLCKTEGKNPDWYDLAGPVCMVANPRRTIIRPTRGITMVSGGLVPNERHQQALLDIAAKSKDVVVTMPQTVIDQVAEVSKAASTPPAPESPPSS